MKPPVSRVLHSPPFVYLHIHEGSFQYHLLTLKHTCSLLTISTELSVFEKSTGWELGVVGHTYNRTLAGLWKEGQELKATIGYSRPCLKKTG